MKHASRFPIGRVGALLWMTLILGLYYWVHKPLTPPLARALGGATLDVAVALLFALVGGGLGRRLLKPLDLSVWSVPERTAAAGLIGLPVLSLLILAVGVVLLKPVSVAALLVGVAALTWRDVFGWVGELIGWLWHGFPRDHWQRFLAVGVLLLVLMALVLSTLPPTKFDVLTYHLAGPEQYVEHGRFYAVEHNHFLGFPQVVDTLYAGQLALTGRLTGSSLIHWVIGVFLLLMAGGFAARRSGPAAGWAAVIVLLVAVTIWMEMTFAYADLLPVALAVFGMAVLERWSTVQRDEIKYLLLLGVIAGFGMSTKYTVLWLGVAFGLLVVGEGWRNRGWCAGLVFGFIYGIVASVTLAPWLVRNVIWYDNPVYPLVFEAAEMDSIRQEWYGQPGSGLIYGDDAWQVPVLPITATFLGLEGGPGYGTDIGPLFLILTPFVLLAWKQFDAPERDIIVRILVFAAILTAIWTITAAFGSHVSLRTRFILYMFGPLAVLSGITLEALRRLSKQPFDLSFIVHAMVALTVIFTLISSVRFFMDHGLHIYFSGEDDYETAYLQDRLGWHYETMRQINRLPEGTTVRFLWEPRYLYCDNERLTCHTDSLMDAWYYARRTVNDGDPAAIAEQWRAGADYLLLYEFGRDYEEEDTELYDRADWIAWQAFVKDYLVEEWHNANSDGEVLYVLYSWKE